MIVRKVRNNREEFFIRAVHYGSDRKRYQKDFRHNLDGQRIGSREEAEKLDSIYVAKFKSQFNPDYSTLPFTLYLEKFFEKMSLSTKKSTFASISTVLKKWIPEDISQKPLREISKEDAFDFIFKHIPQRNGPPATQKSVLKYIKQVMNRAFKENLIRKNPFSGLKVEVPDNGKTCLNIRESGIFLKSAKNSDHPFFYVWCLAMLTGMRNGELYSLRWRNVDLKSKKIFVKTTWHPVGGLDKTKSKKYRSVPISENLFKILIQLKELGPFQESIKTAGGGIVQCDDLVLPRLAAWKNKEQSRITKDFCNLIGIPPVRFHDLRATFITSLLTQNVPLTPVMSVVGHKDTKTTDSYIRLAGVDVEGATDNLGYRKFNRLESSLLEQSHERRCS